MTFREFVFDFENLVIQSEIIRCTLEAVEYQLCQDLNKDNCAILMGISNSIADLDRNMQHFFETGWKSIQ